MKDRSRDHLKKNVEELRERLREAEETIDAIRNNQVDALMLNNSNNETELYTLKTADRSYRAFIEKMIEGAVTVNEKGVILFANNRFAEMVSKDLFAVIGMHFTDFVRNDFKEQFIDVFKKSWTEDQKKEVVLINGDSFLPIQLSLTLLELPEGSALSVFITDLTIQKNVQTQLEEKNDELLKLNNELEASNNDLMQFASVASHDLQEPLRKIQMFTNVLKDRREKLNEKESEMYIEKIHFSAARMRALIIDVLNYSKLSENDSNFQLVDLNEIVSEVITDFELLIGEKKAIINVICLPCILGKRGQIRQVFQNIISNSLKFSKPDTIPLININCYNVKDKNFEGVEEANGPFTIVSIKDNGIGFDDKYQSNIFALFERLNTKDAYEGTGIGMAIAKKIMDKHHGLIQAKGKPNGGAEFSLLFNSCK